MTQSEVEPSLAEHFRPEDIECLIRTAADLYESAGDPHDVLSERQKELARRAQDAMSGEDGAPTERDMTTPPTDEQATVPERLPAWAGWTGPHQVGDMVIVYTGQVTLGRGLIGRITDIHPRGLSLALRSPRSHPPLWFPATGITAIAELAP